jgi:hypothetical protein
MASKLERAVVLPESIYRQIWKLAEKEYNIPMVTRQLLAKALADRKGKPDWFYELQEQIVALRNEVVVAQRPHGKSEELMLSELRNMIAELRKDVLALAVAGPPKPEVEEQKADVLKPYEQKYESLSAALEAKKAVYSQQSEKGKVLRPFFGRLTAMFGGARNEVKAAREQSLVRESAG